MKDILQSIGRNASSESYKEKIFQSVLNQITDNSALQKAIGEIHPFLTDGDRQLRTSAMMLLAFLNEQFKIQPVNKAIFEMAITKLSDNATLDPAIKIVNESLAIATDEDLQNILLSLFSVDLRSNILAHRLAAYKLLEKLIDSKGLVIPPTEDVINSFRRFCGYEQDPRCLTIVFKIFPKFSLRILPDIDEDLRAKLFDTVSVFYPITQRPELSSQLCQCLTELPQYSDDVAAMVASKLSNALSDTRSPVFASLSQLLVHPASDRYVADIVVSFAKALREYFANGSTDTAASVVDAAISAMIHFIDINTNSHQNLVQTAMSNWIPEIINSTDTATIRSFSIVAWSLDTVLHFSSIAMTPLSSTLEGALKKSDGGRVQAIIASMIEFLKFHSPVEGEDEQLSPFFTTAVKVLSGPFSPNVIMSATVLIREIAKHCVPPFDPSAVPAILGKIEHAAPCFIALSSHSNYSESLKCEVIEPVLSSLKTGEPIKGAKINEVVALATRLASSPFFSSSFLPALAETGRTRDLLRCILPVKSLDNETSMLIFEALSKSAQSSSKDAVIATALRSSDSVLAEAISKFRNISSFLIYVAPLSAIPSDAPLDDELAAFAFGAKTTDYPAGFVPPATSLAFRNELVDKFTDEDIGKLLDYENLMDGACGDIFAKFDIIGERFLYNPDYKMGLWGKWCQKLEGNLAALVKLCLLCPPDCFQSALQRMMPLLPGFLDADTKGGLDLTIFALMSMEGRLMPAFICAMSEIVPRLISIIEKGDGPERLDACRVLRAMAARINRDACSAHRHKVVRALGRALDDPKREVRAEAAQARNVWLKVSP